MKGASPNLTDRHWRSLIGRGFELKRRRWIPSEDHHLVSAYRHVPTASIAVELRRTLTAVKQRVSDLNLTRATPRWNPDEDAFLRQNYQKLSTQLISEKLGRTTGGIYSRAWQIGLMESIPPSRRRRWTPAEDRVLGESYGKVRPSNLARCLKRTRGAVWHRAERLGLFSPLGSGEYVRRQALPRTARPFTGLQSPADRGYVAGIIDGEGSVGPPPRVFVSVGTTTKSLAVHLRELAGGSIAGPYQYQKTKVFGSRRCRVKPQYRWNYASRYHVYLLLKAIQPHLVVKAREARKAIRHFEKQFGWGANEADKTAGDKNRRDANRSNGYRANVESIISVAGGSPAVREGI